MMKKLFSLMTVMFFLCFGLMMFSLPAMAQNATCSHVVSGVVNPDGTAEYGSPGTCTGSFNYCSTHNSTGKYTITFQPTFSDVYGASVTLIRNDGDKTAAATINKLDTTEMQVKTGQNSGSASDRKFTFIVCGE